MPRSENKNFTFYILLTSIVLVGVYFRVYWLPEQVLVDDEWHGISFVMGKSYLEVLGQCNPNDYSSPILNIWRLFLYNSWHWSELGLRAPVFFAGVFALILIPLLIRRKFGNGVALVFGLFASLSPQMIFYSRYCRGYSLALLFGCFAIFLFANFLEKGRLIDALLFLIVSSLAVWSHTFLLIAILALFLTAFGVKLSKISKPHTDEGIIGVDFRYIFVLAVLSAAIGIGLLFPMLKNISYLPWDSGEFTIHAILSALELICGTANVPIVAIFWGLILVGIFGVLSREMLFDIMFLVMICCYLAVLILSRPMGVSAGAVIVRYMIILVPIFLLLAAFGLDRALKRLLKIVGLQNKSVAKILSPMGIRFLNICNVKSITSIRRTGADVIILHKYLDALFILRDSRESIRVYYKSVPLLKKYYKKYFGTPIFEDDEVVCYLTDKG